MILKKFRSDLGDKAWRCLSIYTAKGPYDLVIHNSVAYTYLVHVLINAIKKQQDNGYILSNTNRTTIVMIKFRNYIQQISDKTCLSMNEIWILAMIRMLYKRFEIATLTLQEED